MGQKLEQALAILNGVVGDHLDRTGNGLATEMALIHEGQALVIEKSALRRVHPRPRRKVALFVHGLMNTEDAWRFTDGDDYGSLLTRHLRYSPLYLRYNSGRAISDNGAALASMLQTLTEQWPTRLSEILLVGYSMGGLVVRSACHVAAAAQMPWLGLVQRAIYLGTPHRGAPMERAGRVLTRALRAIPDPTTQLIGQIADLRSDGIKDLGDADLRKGDRQPGRGFLLRDARHPVPLLPQIRHHLIAGALGNEPWLAALFGDAVVSITSATDGQRPHDLPLERERIRIMPRLTHLDLPHDPEVYAQIRAWCEEPT